MTYFHPAAQYGLYAARYFSKVNSTSTDILLQCAHVTVGSVKPQTTQTATNSVSVMRSVQV
jgi:hypothetical protein